MNQAHQTSAHRIEKASKQLQKNTLGNSQARGFQQQKFQQHGLTRSKEAKQINGSLSHSHNNHRHSAWKLR